MSGTGRLHRWGARPHRELRRPNRPEFSRLGFWPRDRRGSLWHRRVLQLIGPPPRRLGEGGQLPPPLGRRTPTRQRQNQLARFEPLAPSRHSCPGTCPRSTRRAGVREAVRCPAHLSIRGRHRESASRSMRGLQPRSGDQIDVLAAGECRNRRHASTRQRESPCSPHARGHGRRRLRAVGGQIATGLFGQRSRQVETRTTPRTMSLPRRSPR